MNFLIAPENCFILNLKKKVPIRMVTLSFPFCQKRKKPVLFNSTVYQGIKYEWIYFIHPKFSWNTARGLNQLLFYFPASKCLNTYSGYISIRTSNKSTENTSEEIAFFSGKNCFIFKRIRLVAVLFQILVHVLKLKAKKSKIKKILYFIH